MAPGVASMTTTTPEGSTSCSAAQMAWRLRGEGGAGAVGGGRGFAGRLRGQGSIGQLADGCSSASSVDGQATWTDRAHGYTPGDASAGQGGGAPVLEIQQQGGRVLALGLLVHLQHKSGRGSRG